MTFKEAAIAILQRSRRPLTVREILQRIENEGLFRPAGATPEKSLYSIIVRANARAKDARGPRFKVHRDENGVRYSLSHGPR